MRVLILNGGPGNDGGGPCREIRDAIVNESGVRGWSAEVFDLDGLDIKPCRGCFACWLKHPGTCAIRDGQEPILRSQAAADVVVWLTPIVFGGYSAALKKALDRSIPNALPFFVKRHGEIHHPMRYAKRQAFLAFGTLPSPDPEAERIFRDLVHRNAINLAATATESLVVAGGAGAEGISAMIKKFFESTEATR